jgi:hypothetical protein
VIPLEPQVALGALPGRRRSWEDLDRALHETGIDGLAIPSVRWGLDLVLGHLGFFRYRDVLVAPRFLSRCLLNVLTRRTRAQETAAPDGEAAAVLVVHHFGFRQDLSAISRRFPGAALIEDVPAGLPAWPFDASRSVCRLSAVSKCLPVVCGAVCETADVGLREKVRDMRARDTWMGWWSWAVVARARMRPGSVASGTLNAANEVLPDVRGGCAPLRMNYGRALDGLRHARAAYQERVSVARQVLGERVLVPDGVDPGQVLLVCARDATALAQRLRQHDVATGVYHFDAAAGCAEPRWEEVVPLPAATVDMQRFRELVQVAREAS